MTIKSISEFSEADPDWMEENSAYFRNYRVIAAMEGQLVAGPSEIADEIIGLLRSDFDLSREARDAMADALLAGRGGYRPRSDNPELYRPYLAVGGTGNRGKLAKLVLKRREWLDAADEFAAENDAGNKGDAVLIMVGAKHGFQYGTMQNAVRLRKQFLEEYNDQDSRLHTLLKAKGVSKDQFHELEEYDHWQYVCRSYFIEREASEEMKGVTFEDFEG